MIENIIVIFIYSIVCAVIGYIIGRIDNYYSNYTYGIIAIIAISSFTIGVLMCAKFMEYFVQ